MATHGHACTRGISNYCKKHGLEKIIIGFDNRLQSKSFAGLLFLIGIKIALSSIIALGVNFSPVPQPKKNSTLVKDKIYSYCRHPLYLSLLTISLSINIYLLSYIHILLLIALLWILIIKARFEEGRLRVKFNDYRNYMKNTPAILKGIKLLDWRI